MEHAHDRRRIGGGVAAALLLCLCGGMSQRAVAQHARRDLAGTTWRLVSLTMSKQTVMPNDQAKYTLSFRKDGMVDVHADCNRGHGPFKDPPRGALEIGPITLTKAKCAPGSIADEFARALGFTQSYEVRDGHLMLGISPNGDTLRFERAKMKGK